jgi:crotonobetainyl-CoA:carnitine CoA-transferase CaiB-like acyl-CoA transferase
MGERAEGERFMSRDSDALRDIWAVLGGAPDLLQHVSYEGPEGLLPANLPVMDLARGSVGACSLAAAELAKRRSHGKTMPRVRIHNGAVAAAFTSERLLRIDERAATAFAPLSGYWRAADGWVRTHANYAHHRSRLLRALGIGEDGEDETLVRATAEVLAHVPAQQIEERVYAAGGLAVAVRTCEEWAVHPQGMAAAEQRLVQRETTQEWHRETERAAVAAPARGIRVLDLTRVIAGPVATRTLALLGADVLRIDAPDLPEDPEAHADTGFGKRSIALNLARHADRRTFDGLLEYADVVITGYRPGALDRYGLSPAEMSRRRPGVVVAHLSAWGHGGPWSDRRGFDSLVQAASGIAVCEGGPEGNPGALPAQALDHGTGYLLAAAVLRSLTERMDTGVGSQSRLSLATTASWLLRQPRLYEPSADDFDATPWLTQTRSYLGRLRHARAPIAYEGAPTRWSRPPGPMGTDEAAWLRP